MSPSARSSPHSDKLIATGSIIINPENFGYRSAFVGTVLQTIPGVHAERTAKRYRLSLVSPEAAAPGDAWSSADTVTFEGDLSIPSSAEARGEQALLRRGLLGSAATAACAICGDVYPTRFLVAAHIKKRAICTDAERRDLSPVAMAACVFGCDVLYETGHITVDAHGRVMVAACDEDSATDRRLRNSTVWIAPRSAADLLSTSNGIARIGGWDRPARRNDPASLNACLIASGERRRHYAERLSRSTLRDTPPVTRRRDPWTSAQRWLHHSPGLIPKEYLRAMPRPSRGRDLPAEGSPRFVRARLAATMASPATEPQVGRTPARSPRSCGRPLQCRHARPQPSPRTPSLRIVQRSMYASGHQLRPPSLGRSSRPLGSGSSPNPRTPA